MTVGALATCKPCASASPREAATGHGTHHCVGIRTISFTAQRRSARSADTTARATSSGCSLSGLCSLKLG